MGDINETKQLEIDADMRAVYGLRVFVVGGGFDYIKMFKDAGFKGARSVDDADVICFTGGEDVDPSLYGEKCLAGTNYNVRRDEYDADIYGQAVALKKPMVGICRGGQFLNVMEGGKMWQDVNNHAGRIHDVVDIKSGKVVEGMTSTHHQQMIPAENNVLCFQPHPEFRHGPCRNYFLSLVDEYVIPAC